VSILAVAKIENISNWLRRWWQIKYNENEWSSRNFMEVIERLQSKFWLSNCFEMALFLHVNSHNTKPSFLKNPHIADKSWISMNFGGLFFMKNDALKFSNQ
jgi:hypothetical protein